MSQIPTRNVLRNLMANAVAKRMNFVGRGGKTAITNIKCYMSLLVKNTIVFFVSIHRVWSGKIILHRNRMRCCPCVWRAGLEGGRFDTV